MARRGRKRKLINREPNGRAQRSLQPLADVRTVAMNQPHRKGSASDRLASAVGRLIESGGYLCSGLSKSGLHESANRFAEAYSRWQSVVGSARPFANSTAGTDRDIEEEKANQYRKEWADAWRALRHSGERNERAVFITVIDPQAEDWRPPYWVMYACIEGLMVLADHFGIDIHGEDKEAPSQNRQAA